MNPGLPLRRFIPCLHPRCRRQFANAHGLSRHLGKAHGQTLADAIREVRGRLAFRERGGGRSDKA